MIKSYLTIALRKVIAERGYSLINIGGLAVGMGVAMLVAIWIISELSFNQIHQNYPKVGKLMHHVNFNGERLSLIYMPHLVGKEIKNNFAEDFEYVVMASLDGEHVLEHDEQNKFKITGNFMGVDAPSLLSLTMLQGTRASLNEPNAILLSASASVTLFGTANPMGQRVKVDGQHNLKVTGVYEDYGQQSDFKDLKFIAPWQLYLQAEPRVKTHPTPWEYNNFQTYVQLKPHASFKAVSKKISKTIYNNMAEGRAALFDKALFIHPMSKWHLYSEFKNGVNTGGRIEYVQLFGVVGAFVLFMACINFMNLSTARSEKRAKEVGIRKTLGGLRGQLMLQFFFESAVQAFIAFLVAIPIVLLMLPFFGSVAEKDIVLPLSSPYFWAAGAVFSILTGTIAGSYPAIYLSSMQPVKVLKGTFKAGRYASLPRKVLVVLQFTISLILIVGTVVIFRQIQFAKSRPIGYDKHGLVVFNTTEKIHQSFTAFRAELLGTPAVVEVSETANPTTDYLVSDTDIDWVGKDPGLSLEFPISNVTPEYGATIGWQVTQGRDFRRGSLADKQAFVLNQAAVDFMGLDEPIGTTVTWKGAPYKVIGVIEDIVFESPYKPVRPAIYQMTGDRTYWVTTRINPNVSSQQALTELRAVYDKYEAYFPFDYRFVDLEYAQKFQYEERIRNILGFFSILAIFISCLGIFGLAAFAAEQRVKEIGIRKVLGSSVISLWALLSKDFVTLIVIAIVIGVPISYFLMTNWLSDFQYRTNLPFWIFLIAAFGAMVITIITISYHTIKAATSNPVRSLRSE